MTLHWLPVCKSFYLSFIVFFKHWFSPSTFSLNIVLNSFMLRTLGCIFFVKGAMQMKSLLLLVTASSLKLKTCLWQHSLQKQVYIPLHPSLFQKHPTEYIQGSPDQDYVIRIWCLMTNHIGGVFSHNQDTSMHVNVVNEVRLVLKPKGRWLIRLPLHL